MSSIEWATWVQAIGSLLVVIVALLGEKISGMIFRPKLSVKVGNESPYLEKIKESGNSSGAGNPTTSSARINIEISNEHNTPADSCRVLAEKIFKQRSGEHSFFIYKHFRPTAFPSTNDPTDNRIFKGIPSFLQLAEIRMEQSGVSEVGASGTTANTFSIFLRILETNGDESLPIRLEAGTYMIPLTVHARNLGAPMKKYVYFFWKSVDPGAIDSEHFDIHLEDDKEAERLLGEAAND